MSLTAPWSLSAVKTLPTDFGNGPKPFTTETWVLKPVVAPQERSNTSAALLPFGARDSEINLFSQGSTQEVSEIDRATSVNAFVKCDTAHRSRGS